MKRVLAILLLTLVFSSLSFSQDSISYRLALDASPTIVNVLEVDSNTYSRVSLKHFIRKANDLGLPSLPSVDLKFIVPREACNLKITANPIGEAEEFLLEFPLSPCQLPIPIGVSPSMDSFVPPNLLYYELDTIQTKTTLGWYRDAHILSVSIIPFLYSLQQNKLWYYRQVQINISWGTSDPKCVYPTLMQYPNLSSMIINTEDVERFIEKNPAQLDNERVEIMKQKMRAYNLPLDCEYLLITTKDMEPAFAPLLDWRHRNGLTVATAIVDDIYKIYFEDFLTHLQDKPARIRQYLSDLMITSQGKLRFVLLGGRIDKVPSRSFRPGPEGQIATDFYYAELTGGWYTLKIPEDNVPDVAVGRISANDQSEVSNWFSKLLCYELYPGKGDADYLMKGFMTQSDEMLDNNSAITAFAGEHSKWNGQLTIWDEEGGSNTANTPNHPKGREVIRESSKGYGLLSYVGHGSYRGVSVATKGLNDWTPGIRSKYVVNSFDSILEQVAIEEEGNGLDNLDNIFKPSIVLSMSCNNVEMNLTHPEQRNFGETYTCILKGGGPVFIGNSAPGYFLYSENIYCKTFEHTDISIGEAFNIGRSGCDYAPQLKTGNIFGCPALLLWLQKPLKFGFFTNSYNNGILTINGQSLSTRGVQVIVQGYDENDNEIFFKKINPTGNSVSLTSVPASYQIMITCPGYYPYYFPEDIYIQNINIDDEFSRTGYRVFIGSNVTSEGQSGDVVIGTNADVNIEAKSFLLAKGFRSKKGSILKLKKTRK